MMRNLLHSFSLGQEVELKMMSPIINFVKAITVEPILMIAFSGMILFGMVNSRLMYDVVCYQRNEENIGIDCEKLWENLTEEKIVQSQTSNYSFLLALVFLVPVIFMDVTLGLTCSYVFLLSAVPNYIICDW